MGFTAPQIRSEEDIDFSKSEDLFKGKVKTSVHCALEDSSTLFFLNDLLFNVINQSKELQSKLIPLQGKKLNDTQKGTDGGGGASVNVSMAIKNLEVVDGFVTFLDFREISEELIYLFCSLAISSNHSLDQMCS